LLQTSLYQLYVGNQCKGCEKIITFLHQNNINITIINIDEEDCNLPFSLMIVPALVKDNKLIGYGDDIKNHFKKLLQ